MSRPSMLSLSDAGGFMPPLMPSELGTRVGAAARVDGVLASEDVVKERSEKPREAKPRKEIQSRRVKRIEHLPKGNCDPRRVLVRNTGGARATTSFRDPRRARSHE